MKRITADMGLLLVGMLWGMGFIATKFGLNEEITPLYMLTLRFSISAIILLLIFGRRIRNTNIKEIKKFMILAVVFFLGFWLQTIGSKYTSASKSAFYTGVNVIFVPYVAWMLNRKAPDIYTYISSILCLVGIGVISYVPGENLFQINMGDALVILSSIFFGTHIALTGKFAKRYSVDKMITIQTVMIAIMYFVIQLFLSFFEGSGETFRLLNRNELISVLYLGLVSTCLCLLMQAYFQRYTSSVRAAIYLSTESIFAPVFAYLILDEKLTTNVYIGGLFVLIAILLSETKLGLNLIFKKEKK